MLIGGIEAGGTKMVCAVGDHSGNIQAKQSIPTRGPEETLQDIEAFFGDYNLSAIGVGSFGPIDLDKRSNTYGTILHTPKTKWKHVDLRGRLQETYQVPIYINTDVNAACLAEYRYGAGQGVDSCLYITVGTGIGAGLVQNGHIFQGDNHPEMGHLKVIQHPDDTFAGSCPYHGNCLEGLASGPAIEQRYGKKADMLGTDQKVWEIEADYLSQAIANYTLILSPERIIIGGGVMKQQQLYPLIREQVAQRLNNYVDVGSMETFIVAPGLGDDQGVRGAMALTEEK